MRTTATASERPTDSADVTPPPSHRGPAALAGRALRRAVGLDEDLLTRFEGDRRWYTGQLLLVAGVATMATISMTTALTMTTGQPALGWPLIFGAALGVFVGVCDLTIVLPDGQPHRRTPWSYLGRLTFSILMGGLAAMPLTAAILQRDVDHHEEQTRQVDHNAADAAYQQQVAAVRTAAHESHSPAINAATSARDAAHRQTDQALAAADAQRRECNDEINGTRSGQAGEGPRAGAKCTAATDLARRAEDTGRRASDADAALDTTMAAERTDADNRVTALERPDPEPFHPSELGVIDRISKTHERLGTLGTIAFTLALMALDTLPVILKLAHGPTHYERVLIHRQRSAVAELLAPSHSAGGLTEDQQLLALHADDQDPEALDDNDDELERFIRARLIVAPDLQAKDLYAAARDRGYDRSYPTFTRFLRTRELRGHARFAAGNGR
jgi:hypothetical protein